MKAHAKQIQTKLEIQDEIILEAKELSDQVESITQRIQPSQWIVEVAKAIKEGSKLDTTKVLIDQEGLKMEV